MFNVAGGHNVISGLLDFLERYYPGSKLMGFTKGPMGIMEGKAVEIHPEAMVRMPALLIFEMKTRLLKRVSL